MSEATRRGFFSLFGASAAAGAAALNIPDPEAALTPGKIYVIQVEERLSSQKLNSIRQYLYPFETKTGCLFMVLDGGARIAGTARPFYPTDIIAPVTLPELPEIVDVIDPRCGYYDFAHPFEIQINGELVDQCFRAEMFSDGRGIAYYNKMTADGHLMITADGGHVMTGTKIGRMEIRRKEIESAKEVDPAVFS